MKEIILNRGYVAKVDDEDYERLNAHKWQSLKTKGTVYAITYIKSKSFLMHRMLLNLTDPKIHGDHIDHDGLNNQKHNLRPATMAQNQRNKRSAKNSTSKYLGVCWNQSELKWRVQIFTSGKVILLGRFTSETEAAKAYDQAALKFHGEFANLNFKNQ